MGRYEWCETNERIGGERPRENELREQWSCADACIGQVSVHKSREEKCVIKFGKKSGVEQFNRVSVEVEIESGRILGENFVVIVVV